MTREAAIERLAQLRQNLVGYYNLEELHTLCFHLGVDYDGLGGEGKESKARELSPTSNGVAASAT